MPTISPHPDTTLAPDAYRDGLAELFAIGLTVARMVGETAQAEIEKAVIAAKVRKQADARHLNEALEMDKVLADAGTPEMAIQRTEAVAAAYNQVARAVRRTALLAERFERGWATRPVADDSHAMAKRQILRGVAEAIETTEPRERADRLSEALAERMDSPEMAEEIGNRPAEEIIAAVCRDLGVDVGRMGAVEPSLPRGLRERGGAGGASRSSLGLRSHSEAFSEDESDIGLERVCGTPPPSPLPQGEGEAWSFSDDPDLPSLRPSLARLPPGRTSRHR